MFNIATIRKHYALVPLVGFVGLGCGVAVWYILRLATKCPDVAWTRANNSEPWQAYADKKYKLLDMGHDYKEIQKPPKIE